MPTSPEADNAYPQLLSLAVHEFRTPASVVGGYLRMLQRDSETPLSEKQRKFIDEAEKSCGRLVALIEELSEIGKFDAGFIKLSRQPLDLFTLIGEVAGRVDEAKDRDVHLQVRGDASGAPLNGDPTRLRTAFASIFRAILREKPSSSTVIAERRLERRDGRTMAILVIADAENMTTVYESTPRAFDEKRGGLGLVLPMARRVIERHGGRIWSPTLPSNDGTEDEPGSSTSQTAMARGFAIISLPVTE